MKVYVVDASVALKWLVPEDGSDAAAALLSEEAVLVAPTWILPEVTNVLWKLVRKNTLTPSEANSRLRAIRRMEPCLVAPEQLLERALDLGVALSHPIYDTLYVALAERIDGVLVTADTGLLKAVEHTRWARHVRALK